jgi:lipid A 4'-phosphatase
VTVSFALLLVASALFYLFPALDLATARLFFDGAAFPIAANFAVELVRRALYLAEDIGFLLTLALTLRARPFLHLPAKTWLFQMLIFLLGPGLLVNGILKPVWNRARPFQIAEFGGAGHFTSAWVIGDPCCGYRSFVSGEMAGAVALALGLGMVLRANRGTLGAARYRMALLLVLALPLFTAWQRMATGRHFLSDIVIAALLVLTLAAAVQHRLGRLL